MDPCGVRREGACLVPFMVAERELFLANNVYVKWEPYGLAASRAVSHFLIILTMQSIILCRFVI